MPVIKLPKGDGTWEALSIPNVDAISGDYNTYNSFNIGFNNNIMWKSIVTPYTSKPSDMAQSTGSIPVYMPYEGVDNTGIQVVYGTVGTDVGKIWMRRCDTGTWSNWTLVSGGGGIESSNDSVTDIIYVTKAEYDAMTSGEKANKTIMVDEQTADMAIYDSLPIGSVVNYSGDTVPDGWQEIEGKSFMTIVQDANTRTWNVSSTAVSQTQDPVVFDTVQKSYGSKFTRNGNTVVVGDGVSKVRVSASLCTDQTNVPTQAYMIGFIYKNEIAYASGVNEIRRWSTLVLTDTFEVTSGDVISFRALASATPLNIYNRYSGFNPTGSNAYVTFLTVEQID